MMYFITSLPPVISYPPLIYKKYIFLKLLSLEWLLVSSGNKATPTEDVALWRDPSGSGTKVNKKGRRREQGFLNREERKVLILMISSISISTPQIKTTNKVNAPEINAHNLDSTLKPNYHSTCDASHLRIQTTAGGRIQQALSYDGKTTNAGFRPHICVTLGSLTSFHSLCPYL